jgi:hypothetical protein
VFNRKINLNLVPKPEQSRGDVTSNIMKKLKITFILTTFIIFYSCNKVSTNAEIATTKPDSINTSNKISSQTLKPEEILQSEETEEDTITDIKFRELSISISRLLVFDEEKKLDQVQNDTVNIYAELGETIESQKIKVLSNQIKDFTIEQRYETSITITNEGPHCDLTEWKHYYSDWKTLKTNESGKFICDKYSEKEYTKFPEVKIEELKEKVKTECGDEMYKLISKNKKIIENNSEVGISRYFLKIRGKHKDNGKIITKIIIIETPMGC